MALEDKNQKVQIYGLTEKEVFTPKEMQDIVDFANAVLDELQIKLQVINPENVPVEGRPLVVANHPVGSIDGMALISVIGEKRKDVLFPVNDILCQLPGLKGVFIPINKLLIKCF